MANEDKEYRDMKTIMAEKFHLTGQAFHEYMTEYLDSWKTIPIKIAIIGKSGSGKSSFINAIRGLGPRDEGAAKVGGGLKAVTVGIKEYAHPSNELIQYYDLPGVGTAGFEKGYHYLEKIKFKKYDAFVFLTKDRFTTDDVWLMKKIQEENKAHFVSVTHMDQLSVNISHDEGLSPADSRQRARENTRQDVEKLIQGSFDLFLISSREPYVKDWDLADLEAEILKALSDIKREAMILSAYKVGVRSKNYIDQVTVTLRSRVWKVAALSGGVGAIPVPGLSMAVDAGLLVEEILCYLRAYGLNSTAVHKASQDMGVSVEVILHQSGIDTSLLKPLLTLKGLLTKTAVQSFLLIIFKNIAVSEATETAARFIPFIGSVIAGSISFYTTYTLLHKIIDEMDKIARMMDLMLKTHASKPV